MLLNDVAIANGRGSKTLAISPKLSASDLPSIVPLYQATLSVKIH